MDRYISEKEISELMREFQWWCGFEKFTREDAIIYILHCDEVDLIEKKRHADFVASKKAGFAAELKKDYESGKIDEDEYLELRIKNF